MKHSIFRKISTGVLWFCTLITSVLILRFYKVYFTQSLDAESPEISALLNWLFFLFIITVCIALIFSFFNFVRLRNQNPKKIGRSVAIVATCGLLLLLTWVFGNGDALPLIGYKGNENTYMWLKITDMWLYSIYILLALGIFALLGGIIWSYFKKVY